MAKHPVAGISGVLGGLISSAPPTTALADQTPAPAPGRPVEPSGAIVPTSRKTRARRGRPPGRTPAVAIHREKVTLRIDARVIDDYRDWSWAQRCQLGELVERALCSYRKAR